jgi:GNAT superfamily N-acetyltransferase
VIEALALALAALSGSVPEAFPQTLRERLGLSTLRSSRGSLEQVQFSRPDGDRLTVSFGSARVMRRMASAEFVMVVKSITRDRTLSASWTAPVDRFYAEAGVGTADPVLFLDLLQVPAAHRRTGRGSALVAYVLDEARQQGVRAVLLVSKQFFADPSPAPFWRNQGFVSLSDGAAIGAVAMGRGRVLRPDEVVLMGRALPPFRG